MMSVLVRDLDQQWFYSLLVSGVMVGVGGNEVLLEKVQLYVNLSKQFFFIYRARK